MKTNVVLIGSGGEPSLLHSRIIETLEHSPEYLVIYINQDNVDEINGLEYDHIIYDELVDLGCIERDRGITIKSPKHISIFGGGINRYTNVGTEGHPDHICNTLKDFTQWVNSMSSGFEVKHKKPFYQKGRW